MEPHPLTTFTPKLIEEHGVPQVLDVEHSVHVHKPILSGLSSPADYYIRPPEGMSAEELVAWFEALPGFRDFKLTLVPILGLDTFHQPLISSDDFAKKHFHDNHMRIIRVVGKSNDAIAAMTALVEALKRPFDAKLFPHHEDFSISGYKAPEEGRATEVKPLFKPADHNLLIRVERLVSVHLDECNLGREISVSRHATRSQAPELMLTSTRNAPAGVVFLEALANSLPRATEQEIAAATEVAQTASGRPSADAGHHQAHFVPLQAPSRVLAPDVLKKQAIAGLADVLKAGRFAGGLEVSVVQGGAAIDIRFPRTPGSLWIGTSFKEAKHVAELTSLCRSLRADPLLREGWSPIYSFDAKTGTLRIRALETGLEPPSEWKMVPR